MNKLLSDVVTFHKTYNQPVVEKPAIPEIPRQHLRVRLIAEELDELKAAFLANDIVAVADALTDLLYVVNGCVVECGLKDYIDDCHDEVQASNMSKLGADGKPIYREDGKVKKGPNFFEPDLEKILKK
jgi:predicted HAD superfamily Cof-like phosphohydrolase